MPQYRYRPEVLAYLEERGIRPLSSTPPERVRELVNDLYCFELRRLREEIVAREELQGRRLRSEYSARVNDLRQAYPVLALGASSWVEKSGSG